MRRLRFMAWQVAAANILLLFGGLIAAGMRQAPATPNRIRFMTLNAQFFMTAEDRIESNLDELSELIARERPEVLALQESDANSPTGANLNGVRWLARANGLHHYYGPPTSEFTPGVALLSRFRITSARYVMLPAEHSMKRAAIDAVLNTANGPVQVIVVHIQYAEDPGEPDVGYRKDQMAQTRKILALRRNDMPTVIMGDVNAGPGFHGPAYDMLKEAFDDGWTSAGNEENDVAGYTWPSSKPAMRIDFVWLSRSDWDVIPNSAKVVGGRELSDHRGVLVDARDFRR